MKINLNDVRIKKAFRESVPNPAKIEKVYCYYKKNSVFDKPIIINEDGWLIDGYTRYLVAKMLDIPEVPCEIEKDKVENDTINIPSAKEMYKIACQYKNDLVLEWIISEIKKAAKLGKPAIKITSYIPMQTYFALKKAGYDIREYEDSMVVAWGTKGEK